MQIRMTKTVRYDGRIYRHGTIHVVSEQAGRELIDAGMARRQFTYTGQGCDGRAQATEDRPGDRGRAE